MRLAARVKLRSSATARNAARTLRSLSCIGEWYSHPCTHLTVYPVSHSARRLKVGATTDHAKAPLGHERVGSVGVGLWLYGNQLWPRAGGQPRGRRRHQ